MSCAVLGNQTVCLEDVLVKLYIRLESHVDHTDLEILVLLSVKCWYFHIQFFVFEIRYNS